MVQKTFQYPKRSPHALLNVDFVYNVSSDFISLQ